MTSIKSYAEFRVLNSEYKVAMEHAKIWELSVYETYNGRQTLHIMSMLAYMKNQYRGFSHCNNEHHYNSIRTNDVDGRLFTEATHGFELSKKYMLLGPAIWKWNAEKKCRRYLK